MGHPESFDKLRTGSVGGGQDYRIIRDKNTDPSLTLRMTNQPEMSS
jgi:hypothetical protein